MALYLLAALIMVFGAIVFAINGHWLYALTMIGIAISLFFIGKSLTESDAEGNNRAR